MLAALLALSAPAQIDVSREVIYQANLRAIGPTHDFRALQARLPAIRRLGVTTLWLMPIHPIGQVRSAGGLGSPYSIRDYKGVNPELGTLQDFRNLLAEARRHRMKVMLDWVANHTAWDHPWITQHPDWFSRGTDGQITIPPGTNWQDVADLNFESRPMRREMIAAMICWVAVGVDGFRCDYADGIPLDFWRESIQEVRRSSRKPMLMLAEGAGAGLPSVGFDLVYDWESFGAMQRVTKGASTATDAFKVLRRGTAPGLRFITNHDEYAWHGTPAEMFGSDEAAMAAFAASALTPGGTPLVYCGQEAPSQGRIPFFTKSSIAFEGGDKQRKQIAEILRLRRTLPSSPTQVLDRSNARVLHLRVEEGRAAWQVIVNLGPETALVDGKSLPAWQWSVRRN